MLIGFDWSLAQVYGVFDSEASRSHRSAADSGQSRKNQPRSLVHHSRCNIYQRGMNQPAVRNVFLAASGIEKKSFGQ